MGAVREIVIAVLFLLVSSAYAQSSKPVTWDLQQVLGRSGNISFTQEGGQVLETVQAEHINQAFAIRDRLGDEMGIYPRLVLFSGQRPQAYALDKREQFYIYLSAPTLRLFSQDPNKLAAILAVETARLAKGTATQKSDSDGIMRAIFQAAGMAVDKNLQKRGGDGGQGEQLGKWLGEITKRDYTPAEESVAYRVAAQSMKNAGFQSSGLELVASDLKNKFGDSSNLWSTSSWPLTQRLGLIQSLARTGNTQQAIATVAAKSPTASQSATISPDAKSIFQQGAAALKEKNYERSMELFRRSAQLGYPYANYAIGFHYRSGLGVSKSTADAEQYFQKAADSGVPAAFEGVAAMMLANKKDKDEVLKYVQRGIDANDDRAKGLGSLLYFFGTGTTKDEKKGIALAQDTASKDPRSAYVLGIAALKGVEQEKSVETARYWLERSSKNYEPAKKMLDQLDKKTN